MTRLPSERSRIAWWGLTAVLASFLVFATYRFVGTVVLAIFVYYGTRPVYHRVRPHVGSDEHAASATVFLLAVPVLAFVAYLAAMGLSELSTFAEQYQQILQPYVNVEALQSSPVETVRSAFRDSDGGGRAGSAATAVLGVLGAATTAVMHTFFALLIAFYLLREERDISGWFRSEVAERGSAGYAYVSAVDTDLETVYFSTTLLVFVVAVVALFVYHGYNFLAPQAVAVPIPTAVAIATGMASLIPLVVGKVVYLPLVGYLSVSALQADGSLLVYPLALLVVAFLLLDFVPLTFVLPKLAARSTHTGLVLFGYIGGPMLFGWYGLFLGPFIVVLSVQVVRLVFSELIHGQPVTPYVTAAESIGSDPPPNDD
ncbi:Predicted PurR-regulated permease PerM [Halopelagius inordinatus]|uniref:Predicted PurR-regulated permease PerM n=1 Tax=Halopelagius inordinatus TaxID=553467 RepID=A0A1I2P6M4_9EURY|nr:AI-2E family transporter [Halopelagius inordinatus]SFG11768.1 Predicted PurR-regulated permease PerM [Halopelagius inordinatus]